MSLRNADEVAVFCENGEMKIVVTEQNHTKYLQYPYSDFIPEISECGFCEQNLQLVLTPTPDLLHWDVTLMSRRNKIRSFVVSKDDVYKEISKELCGRGGAVLAVEPVT